MAKGFDLALYLYLKKKNDCWPNKFEDIGVKEM